MKHIFILCSSPFTKEISERLGIELLRKSFKVTYLDCFLLLNKNTSIKFEKYNPIDLCKIEVTDFQELKIAIDEHKPDYFLDSIGRNQHTTSIQKLCKQNKILYIFDGIRLNSWINPKDLPQTSFKKFIRSIYDLFYMTVLKWSFFFNKLMPPDIVFVSSTALSKWEQSAKHKIYSAKPSFFEAENLKSNCKKIIDKNFIAFLDDGFVSSFDFHLGFKKFISNESYISRLNKFFTMIEKYFGMPVIIAAHPDSLYYNDYSDLFDGREVYYNQTSRLAKESKLAITTLSTSIVYPILFKKPIALLSFNELPTSYLQEQKCLSNVLERPVLDMDKIKKTHFENNFLDFNELEYNCFIKTHINASAIFINDQFEPLVKYLKENNL